VVRSGRLAHNVRHPTSGQAVAKVLDRFGREDQLDRDALVRLARCRATSGWSRSHVPKPSVPARS
jgi:hypothetical protein